MKRKDIQKIVLAIFVVIIWLTSLLFLTFLQRKSIISDEVFFILGQCLACFAGASFGALIGSFFSNS